METQSDIDLTTMLTRMAGDGVEIQRRVGNIGPIIYITSEKISADTGMPVEVVEASLDDMMKQGLINRVTHRDGRQGIDLGPVAVKKGGQSRWQ